MWENLIRELWVYNGGKTWKYFQTIFLVVTCQCFRENLEPKYLKILDDCLVHVEDGEEAVLLSRVDTDLNLLQVGHVVLPLHRLQSGPQHPQSDRVVAHTGQQRGVLLHEGISRQEVRY